MSALLRPASPALQQALATPGAIRFSADLVTITLIDGVTVFAWTNFDQDLAHAGIRFNSRAPHLGRTGWKTTNQMQVPELTLKIAALNTGFAGGPALQAQIHDGLLDGASFLLERALMGPDLNPDTLGTVGLFAGKVGAIDCDGVTVALTIKGKVNDLDQYVPRNLYRISCNRAFCDAGCTLSRAAFTHPYAAGATPTPVFIPWAGAAPAGYATYQNGTLAITSGVATGSRRTIVAASAVGLTLGYPLPFAPATGDAFAAFQGCDKTQSSGSVQSCTVYGNVQHYRGFPNVPQPAASY